MAEQGAGNIAYSLNKKEYKKILFKNKSIFIFYYALTIIISFFFLTGSFILNGISINKYITKDREENNINKNNQNNNEKNENKKGNQEKNEKNSEKNENKEGNEKKNNGMKEGNTENSQFIDRNAYNYFREFCIQSPFNLINMNEDGIKEVLTLEEIMEGRIANIFVGFKLNSYLFIIILNLIGIFIIIEALLKNLMSSIIVDFIQTNKNNNPYNNPNCVTKSNDSADIYINTNYGKLVSLSFLFIIPFLTTFVLRYVLGVDKYDIKKNPWIKYYIFISLVLPSAVLIVYRLTFDKSITLFSTIYNFIEKKDKEYINFMKQMFSFKFFIIYTFLFILFLFLILHWIYGSINKRVTGIWKYLLYIFIIVTVYYFVPFILASTAISTLFNVYKTNNVSSSESEISSNIQKYGCQSLFDIIVKYNYPCFKK